MSRARSTGRGDEAADRDVLALLEAERRRSRRGLAEAQLVVLRFFPGPDAAPVDGQELLGRVAQECDTVLSLDRETCLMHMPAAPLSLARAQLKKALARPEAASSPHIGLIATLPQDSWELLDPAQVLARLRARLRSCAPGQGCASMVLARGADRDSARVSAAERSFLLAPL